MRILFFDMEFADGKVPGSVFSFGYVVTDEEFCVLEESRDLLINPESTWNEYVKENILAYPMEQIEAAPNFSDRYACLKALFDSVDLAVGFSVSNDNRALRKACERYGLPVLTYRFMDVERLCRMMEEHKDAHGLGGCFAAWCDGVALHAHRSDGDALTTMLLLKAICQAKHVDAEMMALAYPECVGEMQVRDVAKARDEKGKSPKARRRRPRRRKGKEQTSCGQAEKGVLL